MPDSIEGSLQSILNEFHRLTGLPPIAGGAPASAEYSLEMIQQIISNWTPSGGGGSDVPDPLTLVNGLLLGAGPYPDDGDLRYSQPFEVYMRTQADDGNIPIYSSGQEADAIYFGDPNNAGVYGALGLSPSGNFTLYSRNGFDGFSYVETSKLTSVYGGDGVAALQIQPTRVELGDPGGGTFGLLTLNSDGSLTLQNKDQTGGIEVGADGTVTITGFTSGFDPGAVGEDLLPATDDTYDVGSASFRWAETYLSQFLETPKIYSPSGSEIQVRGRAGAATADGQSAEVLGGAGGSGSSGGNGGLVNYNAGNGGSATGAGGSGGIGGDAFFQAGNAGDSDLGGGRAGGTVQLYSGAGGSALDASGSDNGGNGGYLRIRGGLGGNAAGSGFGGDARLVEITAAAGGSSIGAGGGVGGPIDLTSGRGGASGSEDGGNAGRIHLLTERGGFAEDSGGSDTGGAGGPIDLITGMGGEAFGSGTGGAAGHIALTTATGGTSDIGEGGLGGPIDLTSGDGGEGWTDGGNAGHIHLTTGDGGPSLNAGGSSDAGNSGSIQISAGVGGDAAGSGDGGDGGNIVLSAGTGGTSVGGSPGVDGGILLVGLPTADPAVAGQVFTMDAAGLAAALAAGARYLLISDGP